MRDPKIFVRFRDCLIQSTARLDTYGEQVERVGKAVLNRLLPKGTLPTDVQSRKRESNRWRVTNPPHRRFHEFGNRVRAPTANRAALDC